MNKLLIKNLILSPSKNYGILCETETYENKHDFCTITFDTFDEKIEFMLESRQIVKISNIKFWNNSLKVWEIHKDGILVNHNRDYAKNSPPDKIDRYFSENSYGCIQIFIRKDANLVNLFSYCNFNEKDAFDLGFGLSSDEHTFEKTGRLYKFVTIKFFSTQNSQLKCLLFGDSHSEDFKVCKDLHVTSIHASSAYGLINQRSISHAHDITIDTILINNPKCVFVKWGQVDVDFMYYARHKGKTFDDFSTSVLNRYFEFLNMLKTLCSRVVVININPPSVDKNNLWYVKETINRCQLCKDNDIDIDELLNTNIEYIIDLTKRTQRSRRFNEMLEESCLKHEVKLTSNFEDLISSETNNLSPDMLNHDFSDHHITVSFNQMSPKYSIEIHKLILSSIINNIL